jgi:hypothetical protein
MKLENLLKTKEATDEIIMTKEENHSTKKAQPSRRRKPTESMSSNLQDETIPMACSRFF